MTDMTKARRPAVAKLPAPAHSLGGLAGLAGPPALLWVMAPTAAAVMIFAEVALVALIVLTALFGPECLSERAFRILSWPGR